MIISCLGVIVYSNTFNCSFHLDDDYFIVNNLVIRNIQNLQGIFQFYPSRFIVFLSLALNYHFHHFNVFGYHLFNLVVHLTTAFLVWWLALLTLSTPVMKEDRITMHANVIALFVGLVFVSHPLQTEAVTYIWQRATCMAAFFYLASLCFYIKWRLLQINNASSSIRIFYYILSLILAVVAMFTKENAVTLPLMIILFELSFFEGKRGLKWRLAFLPFVLTIIIIPLIMLLTEAGAVRMQQLQNTPTSSIDYLLTQFRVITTYIRLLFIPFNQNISYNYPISRSLFDLPTLISFLFLAGILFWAKQLFLKYRLVSFSIFWFFLTLSLESSLLQLWNIIFEHRLYLPLAGYSLFLVSGLYYLFGNNNFKMMVVILTIIIAFNSILTFQRNKVWENEFTLWDDAVKKSPHRAMAYSYRGLGQYVQGNIAQAISDYNRAITLDPRYAPAYEGRGLIYAKQGNLLKAISDYNKSIEIDSGYVSAYCDRAAIYFSLKEYDKALADVRNIEETGLPVDFERINKLTKEIPDAKRGGVL